MIKRVQVDPEDLEVGSRELEEWVGFRIGEGVCRRLLTDGVRGSRHQKVPWNVRRSILDASSEREMFMRGRKWVL